MLFAEVEGRDGVVPVETARALVTVDGGGVEELVVVEIDGVLVDVGSGLPVDLVSLVVVEGLPELEP